jgi:large subunit ribosomal protein L24
MLIREKDEVLVIRGVDKGTRGKVIKIDREGGRVVIEGVNRAYKHVKRSGKNPQGGRLSKEMAISVSNVMLICPQTGKRTRVGVRFLKDGSKERYSKKSGVGMGQVAAANPKFAQG